MKANLQKKQLTEIINTVFNQKGYEYLFLNEPIYVRLSDFIPSLEIHGLCVTDKMGLTIMGSAGNWNELSVADVNADKMLNEIYQRIKSINNQKSAA